MKFVKRPVEVEAVLWDGLHTSLEKIRGLGSTCRVLMRRDETLAIETLEGTMTATKGDWIVRGVQGEIYPCKPDIFEQTYEAN